MNNELRMKTIQINSYRLFGEQSGPIKRYANEFLYANDSYIFITYKHSNVPAAAVRTSYGCTRGIGTPVFFFLQQTPGKRLRWRFDYV